MLIDLHNHTALCNHASGTIEEYVQAAITQKIDIFGFSDHAPMNFDTYRMRFDEMDSYEAKVLHVKNEMCVGSLGYHHFKKSSVLLG